MTSWPRDGQNSIISSEQNNCNTPRVQLVTSQLESGEKQILCTAPSCFWKHLNDRNGMNRNSIKLNSRLTLLMSFVPNPTNILDHSHQRWLKKKNLARIYKHELAPHPLEPWYVFLLQTVEYYQLFMINSIKKSAFIRTLRFHNRVVPSILDDAIIVDRGLIFTQVTPYL